MNFTLSKHWLIAHPTSMESPGPNWIKLRDIERVQVTRPTTQAGAQLHVFVSGHQVLVQSGYSKEQVAKNEAAEIMKAIDALIDASRDQDEPAGPRMFDRTTTPAAQ